MIRMTHQRRAILNVLESAERPLSPQEILADSSASGADISLTTVYRTLKAVVEAGRAVAVEFVGQAPRYELSGLEHHHHFLCESCDRLFDIPGCPGSLAGLAPKGFTVRAHDLLLIGQCESCA
ncbi:MAG: Fur family ferric uptake transcriptional regulator [Planctomycetota bacterium]|jgi:Fur family ferric uptake transcriptional regulator